MEGKISSMRRVMLIIACMAVSCQLFAQGDIGGNGRILKIEPGKTSKVEVEQLLGKPSEQIAKDDRAKWKYSADGKEIDIEWYKDQLRNCYVRTKGNNKQWSKEDNRFLEIGIDVAVILDKLGLPDNMRIENAAHLMEYKYQDNILHLSFNNGQLLKYEMTGFVSKK